jgi:hypothetical protein
MPLVGLHPLLNLWGIALDPSEYRAWIDPDPALEQHFGEVAIADPVLAVPAYAQQDDCDGKTAALEQRQQNGSSIGYPSLHDHGSCNSAEGIAVLRVSGRTLSILVLFENAERDKPVEHTIQLP